MRPGSLLLAVAAVTAATAGCGGSDQPGSTGANTTVGPVPAVTTPAAKPPPESTGPAENAGGPAATEASPEASPEGPAATGELSSADAAATHTTVTRYIQALNRHDARTVCALLSPGALNLDELPVRRGGCVRSLAASIGRPPEGGAPAWRKTTLVEMKIASLGEDRARATASVTQRFSDRKYVSVEDDVVYVERVGGRWRLAKPSGSLYRAVGYPEPPLRALTPPAGWG
jgi:hypothetical protein